MHLSDKITPAEIAACVAIAREHFGDQCHIEGIYTARCFDKYGNEKWVDHFANTVVTVGKNLMLDSALAGSAYTVTGPFMGFISSVGYSTILPADTMTSHAGWTEAGNANAPTYTGPRKTMAWAAASAGSKALSAALSFAILTIGTIKGAFSVFGSGAVSTIDSTAGTLFSAGLFTGGDRPVQPGDTVQVTYSVGI